MPPAIAAAIVPDSVRAVTVTFIDEELRETRGDALFTVRLRDNRPLQVYGPALRIAGSVYRRSVRP